MKKIFASALLVSLLAACGTTKQPEANPAPVEDKAAATAPATTTTQPVKPVDQIRLDPLKDPNNILSKRSVYFDFDKYDVKEEYRPIVEAHAQFLKQNPNRSVRIEGNADERGSAEYNLALGQKRSEAVRSAMKALGASDSQIEATSNGKEKPRALGSNEAAWAENRRADVIYNGE
jgi:peptidoglycan-associated lipoprotein